MPGWSDSGIQVGGGAPPAAAPPAHLGTFRFDLRQEASLSAVMADVVNSSGIEGETFESEGVRSSIAQRRCITGFSTLKC